MNTTWKKGTLPTSWKQTVVVPILNLWKDATAVLCKMMERRVTERFVYKLEMKGWFTPIQSVFSEREEHHGL